MNSASYQRDVVQYPRPGDLAGYQVEQIRQAVASTRVDDQSVIIVQPHNVQADRKADWLPIALIGGLVVIFLAIIGVLFAAWLLKPNPTITHNNPNCYVWCG